MLEQSLLVFDLFLLPNLIDKGLEVAVAATVSENCLQWGSCPGRAAVVVWSYPPARLLVSHPLSGSHSASPPTPACLMLF